MTTFTAICVALSLFQVRRFPMWCLRGMFSIVKTQQTKDKEFLLAYGFQLDKDRSTKRWNTYTKEIGGMRWHFNLYKPEGRLPYWGDWKSYLTSDPHPSRPNEAFELLPSDLEHVRCLGDPRQPRKYSKTSVYRGDAIYGRYVNEKEMVYCFQTLMEALAPPKPILRPDRLGIELPESWRDFREHVKPLNKIKEYFDKMLKKFPACDISGKDIIGSNPRRRMEEFQKLWPNIVFTFHDMAGDSFFTIARSKADAEEHERIR